MNCLKTSKENLKKKIDKAIRETVELLNKEIEEIERKIKEV